MTRSRSIPAALRGLLDPRQRMAAALILSAAKLPAEAAPLARLWMLAASLEPGVTIADMHLGDRPGALRAARDLIDELLEEA